MVQNLPWKVDKSWVRHYSPRFKEKIINVSREKALNLSLIADVCATFHSSGLHRESL